MTVGRRELSVAVLAIAALVFYLVFLSTTPSGAQINGDSTIRTTSDDGSCDNPVEIATFEGTENASTDEFEVTGDTFRVSYDAVEVDEDEAGSFSIDVLDDDEVLVDFTSIVFEDDEESINVLEGPGTFSLDINSDNFDYIVTVEDCEGTDDNDDDDDEITINNNGSNNDANNQNKQRTGQIINVPNKPLPPTGGLPTYAMVAGAVFAGAGLLSLGIAVRRGRR